MWYLWCLISKAALFPVCCRDNVTNLMDMAQFLKQNGTEDFKVYSDTMCAIYRGVRLRKC